MQFIGIEDVEVMAKPGDKLQGDLAVYPTGLPDSRKSVNELTFWECISCLTGKPEVIEGADYYLQKQEDGSFIKYGIIREVNGCLRAPAEWTRHVVDKYCDLDNKGIFSVRDNWEDWELQNCYSVEKLANGERIYVAVINENADAFCESFKSLTAVWAYLVTDMSVSHCHSLDNIVSNKDTYIRFLKNTLNEYKEKLKNEKRKNHN